MRAAGLVLPLVLSLGVPSAASARTLQPRIVNGVRTARHPSVGALLAGFSPGSAMLQCSGTMIGCRTFLTAAHCVCDGDGPDCLPGGSMVADPTRLFVFLQHAGTFAVESVAVRSDFAFPLADVAVLRLGTPVTGIRPSRLNTAATPAAGTAGTIVGFGRQGGGVHDYGLKREGSVALTDCTTVPQDTSVCWRFRAPLGAPGTDSNTCNGDSGGPLLVDLGTGPVLAGVTSGGDAQECTPPDDSYDADVFRYRAWIASQAGTDLDAAACGAVARIGDPAAQALAFEGTLDEATPSATFTLEAGAGLEELRIALNGDERADFDLYVRHGAPPTTATFDCKDDGPSQFGACVVPAPAAGTWHVLVRRYLGSGAFQLTASLFTDDGSCGSVPSGGGCDDGSACTSGDVCTASGCLGTAAPRSGCTPPLVGGGSSLSLRDSARDSRDALTWKWGRGTATLAALGTPGPGDDYALCVYDEIGASPRLVLGQRIPGANGWTPTSSGWRYVDRAGTAGGTTSVVLKSGLAGGARITLRARGLPLAMPPLPLAQDPAVTVQLVGPASCFESHHPAARVNDEERFQTRAR